MPEFLRWNLGLAATLVLLGFKLKEIRKNPNSPKKKFFVFEETPELLAAAKKYAMGTLLVDPRELDYRRFELLSRLNGEN